MSTTHFLPSTHTAYITATQRTLNPGSPEHCRRDRSVCKPSWVFRIPIQFVRFKFRPVDPSSCVPFFLLWLRLPLLIYYTVGVEFCGMSESGCLVSNTCLMPESDVLVPESCIVLESHCLVSKACLVARLDVWVFESWCQFSETSCWVVNMGLGFLNCVWIPHQKLRELDSPLKQPPR